MVKNPEIGNLDAYHNLWSSNVWPHVAVERIELWALHGDMEAIANDPTVKQYFNRLFERTHLDMDVHGIVGGMLVAGDAYVKLVRDTNGEIVGIHRLPPKNVEIILDEKGLEKEFNVDFDGQKETHPAQDVMHFRWIPQEDSPYGVSLMKGLAPYVNTENRLMTEFLAALDAQAHGKNVNFDSAGNLRVLKAVPLQIAKHTGVPVALLTMQAYDERIDALEMEAFEKTCQSLRDTLRREIIEKVIVPETRRKGFTETVSLGWKRREKLLSPEKTQALIDQFKNGLITLDELKKRTGVADYYV